MIAGVNVKRYVTHEATKYIVVGMLIERSPLLNINNYSEMNLEFKLGDRHQPINFMPFFTEAKYLIN
ncbi:MULTISPECIES: hypothetical protein [unclassified Paenibacillus]|uniref:hypothetical protein n=1 Tax=unclassified Paenibacillus TaxID=185978 RepID=UPI0030FCE106